MNSRIGACPAIEVVHRRRRIAAARRTLGKYQCSVTAIARHYSVDVRSIRG